MALPKKKSRTIRVDGHLYRWLVSRIDDNFEQKIIIEDAELPAQRLVLISTENYSNHRTNAVTPRRIANIIRHALKTGWVSQKKGKDWLLGKESFRKNSKAEKTKSGFDATLVDPETFSLAYWTDLEPVREKYPWPHYEGIFGEFRIWGQIKDLQIGTILADICYRNCTIPHNLSKKKTLEELAFYSDKRNENSLEHEDPRYWDERRFGIGVDAGIIAKDKDYTWMYFGCCAKLDAWAEWRDLVSTNYKYRTWNGHDPISGASLDNGLVRLHETQNSQKYVEIQPALYEKALAQLKIDLEGFFVRLGEWLQIHSNPEIREQILLNFRNYIQL